MRFFRKRKRREDVCDCPVKDVQSTTGLNTCEEQVNLKSENEQLRQEIVSLNKQVEHLEHNAFCLSEDVDRLSLQMKAARECIVFLLKYAKADTSVYHNLYSILKKYNYDKDGFEVYSIAKKETGISVTSYFPVEDSLGYFEEANGYDLLQWIIKAEFGEIEWKALNPPHEIAGNVSFDGKEKDIENFTDKVYAMAVCNLLGMDIENIDNSQYENKKLAAKEVNTEKKQEV